MNPRSHITNALRALGIAIAFASGPSAHAAQSAEVLFPPGVVHYVEISPGGEWIWAYATRGQVTGLLVQNTTTSEIVNVFNSRLRVWRPEWADRSTLLVASTGPAGFRTMAFRFELRDGRVEFEQEWIAVPGWVVDPLPLVEGEVVWGLWGHSRSEVRRVTVDELLEHGKRGQRADVLGKRLVSLDGHIGKWITDSDGRPRVARRDHDLDDDDEDEGFSEILYRGEGKSGFREIYRYGHDDRESEIEVVGFAVDRTHLVVSAYNGHDTKGLYHFDPETGQFGQTLLRLQNADVEDALIDDFTGELIAAVYTDRGDERYHYFSSYGKYILDELDEAFPKDEVAIIGSSADRASSIFYISASTNPGAYYFYDVKTKRSTLVADRGPGIDRDTLASVDSFRVKSADGTEIEAFLTMPPGRAGEPVPLLVMPHGGPFDVRDRRVYDPLVQYLASWGFAVLQPNYRGSGGYGREFVESAKKQWAKAIEDDIDAAVEHAIALPEIDANRLCIVGGSYGGFSALASVVRHENRYRCAISINGVSDVPLIADSSDTADSERALKFYEEFVGDLETEREKLIEVSPAYHVDEIETPILLIYGTADLRVDQDHSQRMRLMLETYGKEHEAMEVVDMEHSPNRDEWVDVARRTRRFLSRYLRPGEPFEEDPARGAAAASHAESPIAIQR